MDNKKTTGGDGGRYFINRKALIVKVSEDLLEGIQMKLVAFNLTVELFYTCGLLFFLPCWYVYFTIKEEIYSNKKIDIRIFSSSLSN